MTIALIAHRATTAASQCAWYFVAFSFDTSLGLGLAISLHRAALRGAAWWEERQRHAGSTASYTRHGGLGGGSLVEPWYEALRHCGDYGDPPSLRRWGLQLVRQPPG